MQITNISEAKASLSKLVEQVLNGQEVIIGKAGKPVAKLVPYTQDTISVNLSNFIDLLTDLSSPTSRVRQEPSSLSVVQIAGSKSLS
jgi:prevent-host-death family protein